jgi:hypothetical protein
MTDLIILSIDGCRHFHLIIDLWFLGLAGLLLVLVGLILKTTGGRRLRQTLSVDEVELGIGTGTVKLKPNRDDVQIAYKLWVELNTRKLGLPFDDKNDVITEVYDSWYAFFGITRQLMKEIPIGKVLSERSTRTLVDISIDVLNKAIRPHLTRWQAHFRRWHAVENGRSGNESLTPQQLQKRFPQFNELIADLKETNKRLMSYSNLLRKLVGMDAGKSA